MPKRLTLPVAGAVTLAAFALLGCARDAPPSGEVVATIPVDPHVGPDLKIGPDGDLWLPASDTFGGSEVAYDDAVNAVVRIDPRRKKVEAVVAVSHPMSALAIGEGAVWATGTDYGPDDAAPRGSLVRIDPNGNRVTAAIDLGDGSPSDVAVGFDSVWVSDSTADVVYRVDPDTGAVVTEIAVTGGPTSLAVTADAVWVTKPATGQVRSIDPDTNAPGRAIGTGSNPAVLESGGAGLFLADYTSADLSLLRAPEGIVRRVAFPSAPSRFAVGDDLVVVVEVEERAMSSLDGSTRRVLIEDRLFVAVALTPDGRTAYAADAEAGAVVQVRLPAP